VTRTDPLLGRLADLALAAPARPVARARARSAARRSLLDALGCHLLALGRPACRRVLATAAVAPTPGGVPVPGTGWRLGPVDAAFALAAGVRWLDFNDTWLAAEWGHPSDTVGGLWATADAIGRGLLPGPRRAQTVGGLLDAMTLAYEVQGRFQLSLALNRLGLDHVLLVRLATAVAATRQLGGGRAAIEAAAAHALLDGGALRAYRQAPNVGPRKSWAAGDASSRGLRLALLVLADPTQYPSAVSDPDHGFEQVVLRGGRLRLPPAGPAPVVERVLYKVRWPVEFHAQTAVEAAVRLHPVVRGRAHAVTRVECWTQEAGLRIIAKTGPLRNPADRDHCLRYAVAVALLRGGLGADDYEARAAADPRIDRLRARTTVAEDPAFTRAYRDPQRRAVANAVRVHFEGGTATERVAILYPEGHPRRRREAEPLLWAKFQGAVTGRYAPAAAARILRLCADPARLDATTVCRLGDLLAADRPWAHASRAREARA